MLLEHEAPLHGCLTWEHEIMFRRIILAGLLGVAALGATGAAPVAAKSGAVIVTGSCTGSTD